MQAMIRVDDKKRMTDEVMKVFKLVDKHEVFP